MTLAPVPPLNWPYLAPLPTGKAPRTLPEQEPHRPTASTPPTALFLSVFQNVRMFTLLSDKAHIFETFSIAHSAAELLGQRWERCALSKMCDVILTSGLGSVPP